MVPEFMAGVALFFLMIFAGVISIPLVAIMTYHRRKMAEIDARRGSGIAEAVRADIDGLRAEVRSLRDTSMQYDLSFDTSLQRLEQRVERIEREGRQRAASQPEQTIVSGVER